MPLRPVQPHRASGLTRGALALAGTTALLAQAAVLSPAWAAPARHGGGSHAAPAAAAAAAGRTKTVTLITGTVVHLRQGADGKPMITLDPGPDGLIPRAAITEDENHLYVIPEQAFGLLAADKLDPALFDVQGLIDAKYDDAHRATLPVIVDYGSGSAAASKARSASFSAADRTVTVPDLGLSAYDTTKAHATRFWDSLTAGADATGAPQRLTEGAHRVDLDGRVKASLDVSVPHIHAPEAWAAGYDGTGVKVAVLDTGYDATHPDLADAVAQSQNFTTDASVVDQNGHGTHVASTIVGSGAASGGKYRGVAPGAKLLVGKVLDSTGYGQDSMVLAGMQWAVNQGADVVSMSLGGDTSDGTDVLSSAVDELSQTSDALFVVAAGNNGGMGDSSVTAPGAATDALTVGAVDDSDQLADFSGRGPRYADGAVKPEIVAPGVGIVAARAAGTALGVPVDDRYTSLDGTSMATPHVAGVAAIVKQEHPAWDGERLKAVLAGSAVGVDDDNPFHTGDGRVDALTAIDQDVFSDAVVDLGFYRWPHDSLPVSHHDLSYTNLGNAPVTLTLDDSALPQGVSLASDTVTVPAHATRSVDVALDPTVEGPGSYAGVVVATPSDSGVPVRTTLSYGLESEKYDVTVKIHLRDGTQAAGHTVALAGQDDWSFQQRTLDRAAGDATVNWRVAPGRYSASALTIGTAADGASEGVAAFEPTVTVRSDTTITLDENDASRFDYTTDRPVVSDGSVLLADWAGDGNATAGIIFTGTYDRLYAQQPDPAAGGTTAASLNWMLSQPEGELTGGDGTTLGLRPVPAPGQAPSAATVPVVDLTAPVVDAGTVDDLDVSGVDGAVAAVAGDCSDLTDTAEALAAAGAEAMVAYPAGGAACAGTLDGAAPLPSFQARPMDVAAVLAAGPAAHLVSHRTPAYVYDLQDSWDDTLPAGATLDGSNDAVAARVETLKTLGTSADSQYRALEMFIGWIPERGVAAYGLVRPVRMPGTVTHYLSVGPHWERQVQVADAANGLVAQLGAPPQPVKAGTRKADTWFGGPITDRVSSYSKAYGWQGQPYRSGNELWTYSPPFVDDAGHWGGVLFTGDYLGRISLDGKEYVRGEDPFMLNGLWIPDGKHRVGYTVRTTRASDFWRRSTDVTTFWGFDTKAPAGDHTLLPLLGVRYGLNLDARNRAAAGRHHLALTFRMPPGVTQHPLHKVRAAVSWNDGRTWKSLSVARCVHHGTFRNGCSVAVTNRSGKSASLKVEATDTAGHVVRQRVIDAYLVR